jgi:hypothetical protein
MSKVAREGGRERLENGLVVVVVVVVFRETGGEWGWCYGGR